jgi:hypothetical protein
VGGIFIYGSPTNFIGGTAPGARNVVSGNLNVAIAIGDPGANGNVLLGNYVGTTADGTGPLPNQWHGIELLNAATGNIVGDTVSGAANRIAYADTPRYDGVRVRDGCEDNAIRGNAIFSNGGLSTSGLGIDRSDDGVTAVSALTFPVLVSAAGQHMTTISGNISGNANRAYLIDFYGNSSAEPSGFGEGKQWIGATVINTTESGGASFNVVFTNAVPIGEFLSATLTDPSGSTSEFSATIPVPAANDTDGDGIPDDYEIAFGLNPSSNADRDLDLDGDGASNHSEFAAGTRANDADSTFRISIDQETDRTIVFVESVAGENYRVEAAPEVTGPWTVLANSLAGTGARLRVVDRATAQRKFYRVRTN